MKHTISLTDRISQVVVRGMGALPDPVKRTLGGKPIRIDGQELNVEAQLGLRLLNLAVGETFETLPLEEGRAQIAAEAWVFGKAVEVGSIDDIKVETRDGMLSARLYKSRDAGATTAGLVYLHGGGWVLGDLGSGDAVSRFLCHQAGVTVISIDYRLAPENKFPAAVHDAIDSYRAVHDRAEEFGIDPSRIAVGGESAGGNLAAVVAQHYATTTANVHPPAFQMLFMPVTDLTSKHRSYSLFEDGFFLTGSQMDWYKAHYLSSPSEAADPRVSPLLAEDVSGVAPAYVAVAGFDVLRDEGEAYAAKLAAAGVPTALRRHEGLTHGVVNATGVGRAAQDALREAAGALRVGLAPGRAHVDGVEKTATTNSGEWTEAANGAG